MFSVLNNSPKISYELDSICSTNIIYSKLPISSMGSVIMSTLLLRKRKQWECMEIEEFYVAVTWIQTRYSNFGIYALVV